MFLVLASKLIHISGAVRPEDFLIFNESKIKRISFRKMHSIVSETSKCSVYGNGLTLLPHTLLTAGMSRNIPFSYT